MKTPGFHLRILLLCVITVISSCDEKEPADIRDQAIGDYDYEATVYVLDGSMLNFLFAENGSCTLTKTDDGIEVNGDGLLIFGGNQVAALGNGFSFQIQSQEVDIDGDNVDIEGYAHIEIAGSTTRYQGVYFPGDKRFSAYFKFNATLNGDPVTAVIGFVGDKVD